MIYTSRIFLISIAWILLSLNAGRAIQTSLTIDSVGRQILEKDGYRFFSFYDSVTRPYQLVVLVDSHKDVLLDIPNTNELIIAIKFDPNGYLQMAKVFLSSGTISAKFPENLKRLAFDISMLDQVSLDSPFLGLRSSQHKLEFLLTTKKAEQGAAANP